MVTGRDAWKLTGILAICYISVQVFLGLTILPFRGKLGVDLLVSLNSLALLFILLLPTLVYGLVKGWSWREAFRWRTTSWQVVVATVLGTFALGLAVSQVTLWLIQLLERSVLLEHSKLTNLLSATTRTQLPTLLLVAVMFPALPEELVFRGVIQQGFERRYSPFGSVILTSLIFAFFHLDPIQGLSVFAIAVFWGWVVWRTQSVLPSLIAHALQNGLTIISVLTATMQESDFEPFGLKAIEPNWGAAIAGLLFWLAMVLILMRCLPKRGEEDGSTADRVLTDQIGTADGSGGIRSSEFNECSGLEG
ncbi:MAG: CPBP family intramembrane metalloprotease [Armatimonadetes bacterium]|nr:CPBP family intramembrane metalloprotease [Armatimonadota bacterium]